MVIRLLLATDDSAAVSTSITVNTADPSWPAWLVEAITYHAQQSARRLRDDLIAQQAIPGDDDHAVPLTAVVPVAQVGR
ncbi:MAG: hypothetical protein E6J77_08190 [Deltaproteobacteria bacterium]|nr:MAG: hypothetical protein E6J77_08190 [Deltaproteobacteria bacterium]